MADYTQQGLYQEGNSLFDDIFGFGDLEVQNINVVGIITAKTFSGVDATSLKDTGGTVKIQATTTGATHSGRAVFNEVELQGKVYDSDGDFGTSGQVLSSDGTDIEWVNAGSLSAGSAAQVSVANEGSDTTCFPLFSTGATGNLQTKSNANLTFNSSNGTLTATSFSGNLTGNVTGTIQTASQTNITSVGTLTGLNVNGTTQIQNGNQLQFGTATNNNIRGHIQATETNDAHLIIATSGGEDIAFKDGGVGGTTNMIIRGDGNVRIQNGNLTVSGDINANGNIVGDNSTNISGIDAITASTLTGSLQTAAQTNITSVGTLTGLTVDGNLILDSTSNYLHIKGALYDKDGQSGSADQVLVSTGTQVDWKDTTSLTASNSQKITITESDTNTAFPITFSAAPGQSGGNTLLSDNQFTYNASSNTVTAGTFSGSGASLTSLNASNLQSGTVADARIPNLNASKITAGTFDVARIPDLSGAKITSGTVAAARIDNLNASKITAGTLADARLSNSSLFVTGMIMMYTGSTAPSGWAICNGQNGTPDLRNRFIVGAGNSYNVGVTGGFDSVSLSESQIPSHTHSFSGSSSHSHGINDPGHTHTMNFNQGNIISSGGAFGLKDSGTANRINTNTTGISVNSQSVTISGNTGGTGGGQAHENRPPYYALMFIMKL